MFGVVGEGLDGLLAVVGLRHGLTGRGEGLGFGCRETLARREEWGMERASDSLTGFRFNMIAGGLRFWSGVGNGGLLPVCAGMPLNRLTIYKCALFTCSPIFLTYKFAPLYSHFAPASPARTKKEVIVVNRTKE